MKFLSAKLYLLTLLTSVVLSGCGGGGGSAASSSSAPPPPPASLSVSYPSPPTYTVGVAISPLIPSVSGSATRFTVSPALPGGLSLDATTGAISGIPSDLANGSQYVITATSASQSATATILLTIVPREHTEQASLGTLALASPDPTTFVATSSTVTFTVSGASLSTAAGDVRVLNNGQTVPASDVQISGNNITVSGALSDGSNKLIVWATDTSGNALSAQSTLWAGSATLNVTVSGQGASNPTVSAHLGDAPSVMEQQTASNGQATFSNVPARTVLLTAVTSDNKFATAATTGNAGTASLTLVGFNAPSTTINNDFSQGTTAWTPSLPSVISLIAHVENVGGTAKARQSTSKVVDREAMRVKRALDRARGAGIKLQQRANAPTNSTDEDLSLTTSGEGPQTVSYTFAVDPGTSSVTVRYRFVTAEVPGGYFGSQYDDGYSVSARSLSQGSQASDVNSMNALGLAAFDANGSTAWKTLTLSVNSAGDTVQVDASVTNVGDGLYDSQIIIDYVAEQPLTVTVDMPNACPSQTVTFSAQGSSVDSATWSGGGTPASGTGSSFPTHFASTGDYTAQASAGGQSGTATVHVSEASGPAWVSRFPTSTSVTDLVNPFQTAVTNFIAALTAAGAPPSISATLRPPERAYLMHYAYAVAKQGLDPSSVPPMDGVDICWEHYDASGNKDSAGSVAAAAQMVAAYGIAYPPALSSRHTEGLAIDMSISWSGDLTINQADGTSVTITSTPRTGAGNSDLWAVGASYGVLKLQSDPPHWSDDGH